MGTENSAGFGEAAVACGGLWAALPPELNLDEMLENQELRRCGVGVEGGVLFSSELVPAEFDRASADGLPLIAGDEGGLGAGAGIGIGAEAGGGVGAGAGVS